MTREAFRDSAARLLDALWNFRESPMVSYRATVLLADYRRAKAELPSLMPAEALCVDGSIGSLVFPTKEDIPAIIYVDRNESFQRQFQQAWQKRRKWFQRDWSRQIENILTTDSTTRAIQAADLLAWLSNKYEVVKRQNNPRDSEHEMLMELWLRAFFFAPTQHRVYDYDAIIAKHQRRQKTE